MLLLLCRYRVGEPIASFLVYRDCRTRVLNMGGSRERWARVVGCPNLDTGDFQFPICGAERRGTFVPLFLGDLHADHLALRVK